MRAWGFECCRRVLHLTFKWYLSFLLFCNELALGSGLEDRGLSSNHKSLPATRTWTCDFTKKSASASVKWVQCCQHYAVKNYLQATIIIPMLLMKQITEVLCTTWEVVTHSGWGMFLEPDFLAWVLPLSLTVWPWASHLCGYKFPMSNENDNVVGLLWVLNKLFHVEWLKGVPDSL